MSETFVAEKPIQTALKDSNIVNSNQGCHFQTILCLVYSFLLYALSHMLGEQHTVVALWTFLKGWGRCGWVGQSDTLCISVHHCAYVSLLEALTCMKFQERALVDTEATRCAGARTK